MRPDDRRQRARLDRELRGTDDDPEAAVPVGTSRRPLAARLRRSVWAGLAVVAAITIALVTSPPLRAIAVDFLGLFRVQRVAVAPVNPGDLPEHLGSSSRLEALLSDQVHVETHGEPAPAADAAAASALAGFTVRLPTVLGPPDSLVVQPPGHAALRVDLARARSILREIHRDAVDLPAELDGAEITVDIPTSVLARYDAMTLLQLPSPVVAAAPPGLPIDAVGEATLEIMGMPRAEAARFSRNVDWTATLVIPIPRYSTSYQEVTTDGVPASLIRHSTHHDLSFLLTWVRDGIIYSLSGTGEAAPAIEIAGSLE